MCVCISKILFTCALHLSKFTQTLCDVLPIEWFSLQSEDFCCQILEGTAHRRIQGEGNWATTELGWAKKMFFSPKLTIFNIVGIGKWQIGLDKNLSAPPKLFFWDPPLVNHWHYQQVREYQSAGRMTRVDSGGIEQN